jgi:hypothetical protein
VFSHVNDFTKNTGTTPPGGAAAPAKFGISPTASWLSSAAGVVCLSMRGMSGANAGLMQLSLQSAAAKKHAGRTISAIGLLVLAASTGSSESPPGAAASPEVAGDSSTRVEMRNVDYYVDPKIALRIRNLHGRMESRRGGAIVFDDKTSFIIAIENAEVGLTGADLSVLLNKYVFGYKGAPLSNLRVSISGNQIVQKGTLRKVASLPFEIHATLSVTPTGQIRIHPVRTEILGLHVDRLMKGLGLSLEKIINLSKAKGASVDGSDIFLAPDQILPPPAIRGSVSEVRIEGDQIVMTFGRGDAALSSPPSDPRVSNYMYYRGGTLRFGKLMMLDADMLITDLDPGDTFRFDLARYQPQLIAGYSKSLASGGLEVFMKDIDKVGR